MRPSPVSPLPHLMSVLMAGHLNAVPAEDLVLAGQGLRDVTRVAGSDPDLWEQILGANSAAVLLELHQVRDELAAMINAIEAGPKVGITSRTPRTRGSRDAEEFRQAWGPPGRV